MSVEWSTLVVAHAVPTLFLTGLIWFVQVVHYPLYQEVGDADRLLAYERAHCRRITPLVLPAMLLELVLAAWLVVAAPDPRMQAWTAFGLVLLSVVWLSTLLLQIPCHNVLQQRPEARVVIRLIATNWVRTVMWTLRAAISVVLLLDS